MARRRSPEARPLNRNAVRAVFTTTGPHIGINIKPLNLSLLDDNRRFHPMGPLRPVAATRRYARALVERAPIKPSTYKPTFPSLKLGFAVPEKVARCVRRKTRREVMFATRQTGKGARSRRKRDYWSNVRC